MTPHNLPSRHIFVSPAFAAGNVGEAQNTASAPKNDLRFTITTCGLEASPALRTAHVLRALR